MPARGALSVVWLAAASACSSPASGGAAAADASADGSPALPDASTDLGREGDAPAVDGGGGDAHASGDAPGGDALAGDAATVPPCPAPLKPSGPIQVSGQTGTVIEGLHVTSTTGACVIVTGSTNVTIRGSEIGPCAGNGIEVSSSSQVTIADNYVHPEFTATGCCDTGDGVLLGSGATNVLVQGNVIAYAESNVEAPNGASSVHVIGNFLLNPRGPFPRGQQVQAWHVKDVWVENNYGLSSTASSWAFPEKQEDAFNFGFTSGTVVARNNYITGGHSASGCGLIADEGANGCLFQDNALLDTGQCGIGIASGTSNVVDGNRVLNRTPVQGGGNTGIYVWSQYSDACGPTTVQNNVGSALKPDGTQSGYWNGGGCDPVTESNDTWDAPAQAALSPPAQKMPPPPIPPQPYACRASSPF